MNVFYEKLDEENGYMTPQNHFENQVVCKANSDQCHMRIQNGLS
jgi:hypothetical protein